MLTFCDFSSGLRRLEIERTSPVIVHASLSAFGQVNGGSETILGALMASYNTIMMPTFTYVTMITPESGPPGNGITYGSGIDSNRIAEFFTPGLPADRTMGIISEALRRYSKANRSMHPILSFAGVNAETALQAQTFSQPLQPIHVLAKAGGWVLLLGVNHTCNTSIHYGERVVGRTQFVRWALTPEGIMECAGWPGCSDGFQAIAPRLETVKRTTQVGLGLIQAIPLVDLVQAVSEAIAEDPFALLCKRPDCERCNAVRKTPN
jgi:aminoglycoside 3-N-acetyltransferase